MSFISNIPLGANCLFHNELGTHKVYVINVDCDNYKFSSCSFYEEIGSDVFIHKTECYRFNSETFILDAATLL